MIEVVFSVLCFVFVSIFAAVFLLALVGIARVYEQKQDDTEAYRRLTTDFQKEE